MLDSPTIDGSMFVIHGHLSWVDELMRFLDVRVDYDLGSIPGLTRQSSVSLGCDHFLVVVESFGVRAYFRISNVSWEYADCLDSRLCKFDLYIQKAHRTAMDPFLWGHLFSAVMSFSCRAEKPHGNPPSRHFFDGSG